MKVYKIKHKPTGLFFTPSKGHGNLSTSGKIYSIKPQIENWLAGGIRIVLRKPYSGRYSKKHKLIMEHFNINFDGRYYVDEHFYVDYNDWEIIEL